MFRVLVILGATFCAWVSAGEQTLSVNLTPVLGKPVGQHQPLLVLPDGQGLPEGSGTALEGKNIYVTHCAACHGVEGNNGINDKLVGGIDTLSTSQPLKTVGSYWPVATTVFDFVRRAMPYQTPGVLSNDEVYAVTAYVLYLNKIVEADTRLDAANLSTVRMPNANGFISAHEQRDP